MKKIQAIALLPVIALASCGKAPETKVDTVAENSQTTTQSDTTVSTGTTLESTGTTSTGQTEAVVISESTGETLNENVALVTTQTKKVQTEKSFEFTYKLGDQTVPVKGKFVLGSTGRIEGMVVEGVDPNGKGPLVEFAKMAPLSVIGKNLKGLKIDTISGASLTTAGFNQYLTTLQ